MKIVLDISMTEYNALLAKVTEGAKAQVELSRAKDDLYQVNVKLSNMTYDLQQANETARSLRQDRTYYSDRCDNYAKDIRHLQDQLRIATTPPPKYTIAEMGKVLANVRNAIPEATGGVPMTGDGYLDNMIMLAKNNQKIGLIKIVREGCACGLKEAKDLVEAIVWDMHTSYDYSDARVAAVIAENRPKNLAEVIAANS